MKIIIVGAGKVGYSVANMLSDEGHDITVIDRNPETISHLSNDLDVICVEGNDTNPETLMEAGAAEAEAMMILIAGTFICNYNKALTGRINGNIIGCLSNLSKS